MESMGKLEFGKVEQIELTEEILKELEKAEQETQVRWSSRVKFVDLKQGIPLAASDIVRYHPQIRPIIKFLEETDPQGFKNLVAENGAVYTITWLYGCHVQITADHIFVWKGSEHYGFCNNEDAFGSAQFEVIPDLIALSERVIETIKKLLNYLLFLLGLLFRPVVLGLPGS